MSMTQPLHILVVNDRQEILDLLQDLLEDEGYRVTTSLALLDVSRLKDLAPNVIIQDLLFAGGQEAGWEFLTIVRLDPALARIPLILCTAAIEVVKDEEMAQRLADQHVTVVLKPFNIEELLTVVQRVLQPKPAATNTET